MRLPHGSLSSTRRQTLRLMVKVHSVVILVPSQKPHRGAPKKDPHNLRTSLRKKKQTCYHDKVLLPAFQHPFPDWESVEVSDILRSALLQSIATTLSKLPPSSFPISLSVFSESYILPYRSFKDVSTASTPVDIKHSGYKSLTAFLKASAKEGLIKVKETKGEVVVTGAYCTEAFGFVSAQMMPRCQPITSKCR